MSNDSSCTYPYCAITDLFPLDLLSGTKDNLLPNQCPFRITSSEYLIRCEPTAAQNLIWACKFDEEYQDFHDPDIYRGPIRDTKFTAGKLDDAALHIFSGLHSLSPYQGPVRNLISNNPASNFGPYIGAAALPLTLLIVALLSIIILFIWGFFHPLRKRRWFIRHSTLESFTPITSNSAHISLVCLLMVFLVIWALSHASESITAYSLPSCVLSRLLYESSFGSLSDVALFEGVVNIEPMIKSFDKSLEKLGFKVANQSVAVDFIAAFKARWGPVTYTSANLRQMQYNVWLTRDGIPKGTALRHDIVLGALFRNTSLFDLEQILGPVEERIQKAQQSVIPQSFTDSATNLLESGRQVCAVLQNVTQEVYASYDTFSRALIHLQATLYGPNSKLSKMLQFIPVLMTILISIILTCILAVVIMHSSLKESFATAFNLITVTFSSVAACLCIILSSIILLLLIYVSDLCHVLKDSLTSPDFFQSVPIGFPSRSLLNDCIGFNSSGQIFPSEKHSHALQDLLNAYRTLESQVDVVSEEVAATAPQISIGKSVIEKYRQVAASVKDPALVFPSLTDLKPWLYVTDPRIVWSNPYVKKAIKFEELDPLSNALLAEEWRKAAASSLMEFPSLNHRVPWDHVMPGIYTSSDVSEALSDLVREDCPLFAGDVCASFDPNCQGKIKIGIYSSHWIPEDIFRSEENLVANFEFLRLNSRRNKMLGALIDCLIDTGSKKAVIMFSEAMYWVSLKELLLKSDEMGLRRFPEDSLHQLSSEYTDLCTISRRCPLYTTGSQEVNKFSLVDHKTFSSLIATDISRALTSNVSELLADSIRHLMEVHPASRLVKSLENLPDILNCKYGRVALEDAYVTICQRITPPLVFSTGLWLVGGILGLISAYLMAWRWHIDNVRNYQTNQLSTTNWPRSP